VTLKALLGVGLLVLAGIQVFGPARTNPPSSPGNALSAKVPIPDHVQKVLSRSCADCHSHETHWPWYSYVAPVSWGVVGDVNNGRDHMNMSDWRYAPEEGAELIDGMCKQVRRRRMPLTAYTWMHRDAKLSDEEIKQVCAWTKDAADQLVPSH
jgi:Haem-binding domain